MHCGLLSDICAPALWFIQRCHVCREAGVQAGHSFLGTPQDLSIICLLSFFPQICSQLLLSASHCKTSSSQPATQGRDKDSPPQPWEDSGRAPWLLHCSLPHEARPLFGSPSPWSDKGTEDGKPSPCYVKNTEGLRDPLEAISSDSVGSGREEVTLFVWRQEMACALLELTA